MTQKMTQDLWAGRRLSTAGSKEEEEDGIIHFANERWKLLSSVAVCVCLCHCVLGGIRAFLPRTPRSRYADVLLTRRALGGEGLLPRAAARHTAMAKLWRVFSSWRRSFFFAFFRSGTPEHLGRGTAFASLVNSCPEFVAIRQS